VLARQTSSEAERARRPHRPVKLSAALSTTEIQVIGRGMAAGDAMLGQKHDHKSMQDGTLLAAIDLGSNSFRLEVGRLDHGHVQRVEYIKETVRQGNGLDSERNLSPEAMQRGWDVWHAFLNASKVSSAAKYAR
jgi:hypothetical protein